MRRRFKRQDFIDNIPAKASQVYWRLLTAATMRVVVQREQLVYRIREGLAVQPPVQNLCLWLYQITGQSPVQRRRALVASYFARLHIAVGCLCIREQPYDCKFVGLAEIEEVSYLVRRQVRGRMTNEVAIQAAGFY